MSHQYTATGCSFSLDTAFDLLHDRRRRAVLTVLNETDRRLSVTELANKIAIRENDPRDPSAHSENVRLSLIHVHLPKLADANVVRYDRERPTVEPGPLFEQTLSHLPASDTEKFAPHLVHEL